MTNRDPKRNIKLGKEETVAKLIKVPQHPWETPPGSRLIVKKAQTIRVWQCIRCRERYDYRPLGEQLHSRYCECGGRLTHVEFCDK